MYYKLGYVSLQQGDLAAARRFYEQSLETRQRLAKADPSNAQAQQDVVASHFLLGTVYEAEKQFAQASDEFRKALAIVEQLLAAGKFVEVSRRQRESFLERIRVCDEASRTGK